MGKWTGILFLPSFSLAFPVDKLYITHSEWSTIFGGARANSSGKDGFQQGRFRRLPLDHCALTLVPFQPQEDIVATRSGIMYSRKAIELYLDEGHSACPVLGTPLSRPDLFEVILSRNKEGAIICPISQNILNDHSHVAAIRPSGHIYLMDTIKTLNINKRHFLDLMTDVPFNKSDVIVLQDPSSLRHRNLNEFQHIRDQMRVPSAARPGSSLRPNQKSIERILSSSNDSLLEKESKRLGLSHDNVSVSFHSRPVHVPSETAVPAAPSRVSTLRTEGKMAASFTSSALSIQTENRLTGSSEQVLKRLKRRR